jgi:hypothetical protein
MTPRLIDSKKWTPFPKELVVQIEKLIHENFTLELQNCKIIVDGRIYAKEIVFSIGYVEKGRITQNNFAASIDYKPGKQKVTDMINACVDACASMMAQYFETQDAQDFPKTWTRFPFENHQVYLVFHRENSELEAEANRILGLSEDEALIRGVDEDEEDFADAVGKINLPQKKKRDDIH